MAFFADEWGPEKILEVYNPKVGMEGILVIDNTALDPRKGGIRMTPSVTVEEVFRLVRTMTWKCALANLPFGGAKAGIIAEPKHISKDHQIELVRAFSHAVRPLSPSQYVAAPDINTGEEEKRARLRLGQWLPEILYGKTNEYVRQTGSKMRHTS